MCNIMESAAEAEYGTIFFNAQTTMPIRTNLNEMGWKQGPTAIKVWWFQSSARKIKGNGYAILLENNRIKKEQFRVFWRPGPENLGDYNSKHHPPEHHIAVQSKYFHVPKLSSLQGCVNLTIMVSPIARQSPAVNPTKREIEQAQLKRYFLDCIY